MTKTRLFIAVVGLLTLAAVAVGIGYLASPSPTTTMQVGLNVQPRKTLMPSDSAVWMEEHVSVPNTDEEFVTIRYRDTGDYGIRHFMHPNVLGEETFWFADGTIRLQAQYATDGKQVLRGFEKRRDGTIIWTAVPADDNVITRTTYWYDGHTPFSIEHRGKGDPVSDVINFYKNGQPWLHTVGKPYDTQKELLARLSKAQVRSNQGLLLFDMQSQAEASQTAIYRANGTLWYKQEYQTYPWYRLSDGSLLRRLTKVTVFSDDGAKIVRELEVSGMSTSTVMKITDYTADGRIEYTPSFWGGAFSLVQTFDSTGKFTGVIDPKTVKVTMEPNLLEQWYVVDPQLEWLKQEHDPNARNVDGSATPPVNRGVE